MHIIPYYSFGPLLFGRSSKNDCIQVLGEPLRSIRNREDVEEFHYKELIIRFDRLASVIRECTLLPYAEAVIDGIPVTWDLEFLRQACDRDGSPKDVYGFIVFISLGIAVTGIHDQDKSQLAITVFSRGDFDDLLKDARAFQLPSEG